MNKTWRESNHQIKKGNVGCMKAQWDDEAVQTHKKSRIWDGEEESEKIVRIRSGIFLKPLTLIWILDVEYRIGYNLINYHFNFRNWIHYPIY